ncbi:MAG: cupin domain-containing protein [Patescibacteria group bacterium]
MSTTVGTTWEEQFQSEGFRDIYVWHNAPGEIYPSHQHNGLTTHAVLQGSLWVRIGSEEKEYVVGDRFDIPAQVAHSARMGDEGCTYVIGEK